MATTVFPEAGDQITEAAWTSANKTIAVATEYRVNGYALSVGTGLNVDISSGTCFVNGFEVVFFSNVLNKSKFYLNQLSFPCNLLFPRRQHIF